MAFRPELHAAAAAAAASMLLPVLRLAPGVASLGVFPLQIKVCLWSALEICQVHSNVHR